MAEEHDGWPADEATEPEGATFVLSNPYILLRGDDGTHVSELWADADEPVTHHEHSAVFTSARTLLIEATSANAICDPSLFEDATEPSYELDGLTDPDGRA